MFSRPFPLALPSWLGLGQAGHALVWCLVGALAWGLAGPAHADDYSDVANLMRNGRPADATARIEQFLQTKPRDAQMRFYKGLIERDAGRLTQAQATFLALTQDYPELPEPHNNLAVIYAAQNELDKARASLEAALRNNPNYATAHENLGDVLARLAAAAWSRARALEGSNASLARKLDLIRPLVAASSPAPATPAVASPASAPASSSNR